MCGVLGSGYIRHVIHTPVVHVENKYTCFTHVIDEYILHMYYTFRNTSVIHVYTLHLYYRCIPYICITGVYPTSVLHV